MVAEIHQAKGEVEAEAGRFENVPRFGRDFNMADAANSPRPRKTLDSDASLLSFISVSFGWIVLNDCEWMWEGVLSLLQKNVKM